jgi:FkbM family methyltransferase
VNPFLNRNFEQYYRSSPLTVVDVGARGGPHERWKPCGEYLHLIGFEPDEDAFRELQARKAGPGVRTFINAGLMDAPKEVEFHITRSAGCSSFLVPNTELLKNFPEPQRYDVISSTKLKTTTLDLALTQAGVQEPDFIKLDTQGTELFILQGASAALSRSVFGIEVEVEFAEIYQGQPLFLNVDKLLSEYGFVLFDLKAVHWKRELGQKVGGRKGQLVFGDALYFRSLPAFFALEACSKAKVLKALSICVAYGFFDFALAICEEAARLGVLNPKEHKLAADSLKRPRHLSTLFPWFRGRDRIADVFYLAHDIFRFQHWAHSGHSGVHLGNTKDPVFRG